MEKNSESLKYAQEYRAVLLDCFNRRRERNGAYSLRAFSRDLSWQPSRLSEVLSGRAGISISKAKTICDRLGLNVQERTHFLALIEVCHGRSASSRLLAREQLSKLSVDGMLLDIDAFKAVSNWYHFAILELTKLSDFRPSSKWIAHKLGLPIITIKQAIERLVRRGFLCRSGKKLYLGSQGNRVDPRVPSEAVRNFHRQILEKARNAIDLQTFNERYLSTVVVAIDEGDLPRIAAKVEAFRKELEGDLEKAAKKTKIYCLAIQFFNLEGVKNDA